jgi:hypothetical protein
MSTAHALQNLPGAAAQGRILVPSSLNSMTAIQELHFAPGNFRDNISPAQLEVQLLQVFAELISNVQHSIVHVTTSMQRSKWHPDFHQHCRCYAG